MGYREYLAIKQYNSIEEKMLHRESMFRKIQEYVDVDEGSLDCHKWMKQCVKFDKIIEVGATDYTGELIYKNKGFIPDAIVDELNENAKRCIIEKTGKDDINGLRIVALSKEDVLYMVQDYHQQVANRYKNLLNMTKVEWETNLLKFNLKAMAKEWEYAANERVEYNNEGKIDIPFPLAWSYEYLIIQLIHILNQYDWEYIDVALYGY